MLRQVRQDRKSSIGYEIFFGIVPSSAFEAQAKAKKGALLKVSFIRLS